jgi:AcrR family transcriptional regulator
MPRRNRETACDNNCYYRLVAVVERTGPVSDADTTAEDLGARLLDAAARVFAERGYDRAGVAEIARRAGVTTGAIYSRYSGKAELLVAALEAYTTDELDALFADHRFEGRAEDVLAIAGSHLVQRSCDAGPGSALLIEAFIAARRDEAVAELMRSHVLERQERLRTIIESAKSSRGIGTDLDTDALVTFCHAVGFGFLLLDAVEAPMPDTARWEQLIAHLIAALAVPAATSSDVTVDLTDDPSLPDHKEP